jgi:hypothetical protein
MMHIIVSAVLFAVAVNPSLSWAQEQNQPAKPMLAVSIRSPESSYNIKENVRLEIQLQNVGDESLLLCRSWGWGVGRTYVRVFDSRGKEVFTSFLADELPPPPQDKDFLQLNPNEFFGIRLSEDATHFLKTPGTYDIFVEYTSTVSEEWVHKYLRLPHLPLWSRDRGTVVSNKIRIEVTK